MERADLARYPNACTKPASLSYGKSVAFVRGYQNYTLHHYHPPRIENDPRLVAKLEAIDKHFDPAGLDVLDLGANVGFFSFLAASRGAMSIRAVEMDPLCCEVLSRAAEWTGLPIEVCCGKIQNQHEPHDIVLALSLVHWIFNLTAGFATLDTALAFLSKLTRDTAFIEWVEPNDSAIALHRHTDGKREYTEERFLNALVKHFREFDLLGETSPTRRIYKATQ